MPKGVCVYQRRGSPYWYVSFFSHERLKRVHEATPWRSDEPNGRRQAEKYATDKLRQAQAAGLANMKGDMFGAWVEPWLRQRYQDKTLVRYLGCWAHVSDYLAQQGVRQPAMFAYRHVAGYMTWRTAQKRHRGTPIAHNTARTEIKIMSVIMAEAVRRGFAILNPCQNLPFPKHESAEKPEITEAQEQLIRSLLDRREGKLPWRDRWMTVCFEIAIHQGCRLSETQIPMDRINIEAKTVQFRGKGHAGKKHVFTTMLHPDLIPLIEKLRAAGVEQTCVLPRMASKEWFLFFKSQPELRNLCFHCTRVTVITRLARAGISISKAMRYVGHATTSIHKIYQRLTSDDLGACVAALK